MFNLNWSRPRRGLAVSAFALITLASSAYAQSVSIQSGNGAPGPLDSLITYEVGPPSSDFGALQPSDFAAAQSGPAAVILYSPAMTSPFWAAPTAVGPTCQWIGTTAVSGTVTSTTALFALPFNWAASTPYNYLSISFSVDDQLGGLGHLPGDPNEGMFIDGTPIYNSASNVDWFGNVETYNLYLGALSAGPHYLYFDDNNSGGEPAGVIFSGTVYAVPEPAPLAALGIGALGLLRLRKRRS